MRSRLLAASLVLLAGLTAAPARAQVRMGRMPEPRSAPRRSSVTLRSLFGVPVAQRLLQSDDPDDRLRGVERLGAIGTDEAIDALTEALTQTSILENDLRVRLLAVRALAPHAKRDGVRQLLTREVVEGTGADARRSYQPLSTVVRGTAALALAKSGDRKAVAALVPALLQGGPAAEAASRALRVYPPVSIDAFVEGKRKLTPALAAFLGEAGDLRALDRLRAMVNEPDLATKVAAELALAKLGDESAILLAREWLKRSEPRLRRAAAEVLVHLSAPEAGPAVAALLENDATREDGLRLALLAPITGLAPKLAEAMPSFPATSRARVVIAIGRARGVPELEKVLAEAKDDIAITAAFALANTPGDAARAAIERGFAAGAKPDRARLMIRAAIVRALALGDTPAGLRRRLDAMITEKSAADRAIAAFGLAALGWEDTSDLIDRACKKPNDCDAAVIGGAARGALANPRGGSALRAFMPILAAAARAESAADPANVPSRDRDEIQKRERMIAAAGVALLASPDGGDLSTSALSAWAERGGPIAPLAARALASRDTDALRGRIKRLLQGSDPVVRAHTAIGLGKDPEPSSVSMLTSAYRFEEDASVRRAIIRGLSLRTEAQRIATLTLARDLDPDDEVRALARSALEGRALDLGTNAPKGVEAKRSLAWVHVLTAGDHPSDDAADVTRSVPARVVRADGAAVPLLADADGALLVPGLPPGFSALRIDHAEGK